MEDFHLNSNVVEEKLGEVVSSRFFREVRTYQQPVALAVLLQLGVYAGVVLFAGRRDFGNIAVVMICLAAVAPIAAIILSSLRRHATPLTSAIIVSVGVFSFCISFLSAVRIPVSYQALALGFPALLACMAFANIRAHHNLITHAALAPFARAEEVARLLDVPVLSGPDADVSRIEMLLIDPAEHHGGEWSRLVSECYVRGIEIISWAQYLEIKRGQVDISMFDASYLSYSSGQFLYSRVKRALDVLVVLISLPLAMPIILATALFILIVDGRPIFFVQPRVGYLGARFNMWKFRTMYKDVEQGKNTAARDSRILPGCRLVRKLRFDETPQLFNILAGHMSLIGPRPVATYVAKSINRIEPKFAMRTAVLPGITGWAQVNAGYAETAEEEINKLSYDLYYLKNFSFDLDLRVALATIRTVVFGAGGR